ncbi:MAG: tetratricopeptide repeat protein [Spirulinaceae cyanobacterium]
MLKLTPVTLIITTPLLLTSPSYAQTPHLTKQLPIQATETNCPPDIAGCPVRGDYFTWTNTPIPYLLSPRHGKILNPQPLLRWLPVEGATSYTVTLEGPGVEGWEKNVTTTAIQYDGDPLQPGGSYQFFVETDTGARSWGEPAHRGGVGDGFEVMTSEERLIVEAAVAERRATITDPNRLRLEIANVYLEHELLAEGIAELEMLRQEEPSPELAVRLGNLHFGWLLLVEPSETYYRQALERLAEPPPLAWAVALTQLGHLHIVKQEYGEAIAFWRRAQGLYNAMGQPQAAAELETDIQRWLPKVEP